MPLTYLLYRCPACGHDPLEGEKDEAWCSECGVQYARGGPGGRIRVQGPSGDVWSVPAPKLTAALEARTREEIGGVENGPTGPSTRRARVQYRRSGRESAVWRGDELLGYAESMGETRWGIIEIGPAGLGLLHDETRNADTHDHAREDWPFLDIRAVQTSSSSLQFSPRSGGLIELRFAEDSPYRWETLLREALRWAYREAGLGEILEFQPRVVAEKEGA